MSTIYSWDDVSTLSGAVDSVNDLVFMFDASTGRTVKVAAGEVQTVTTQTTASNLATFSATTNGAILIGTSTSIFLSAPTKVGIWKYILNNSSSTVVYTVTASGSSFNGALSVFTSGGGGAVTFLSASTLKWLPVSAFEMCASTSSVVTLS